MYGYAPYKAQFLTQEEIDEILTATQIKGRKNSMNASFATPQERLPRENRMLDADGDGICDFLQQ